MRKTNHEEGGML